MKTYFKKLTIPLSVAIFSVFGTLLIQQYLLLKATPNLQRLVVQPDLAGLTPEIRKQISLVAINYSLQNTSRSTAQNVSIFAKSDAFINVPDLKFTQDSEVHQIGLADPHEIRINVPSIRPNGVVSFQILTSAANNINFTELSDNAVINSKGSAVQKTVGDNILRVGVALFAIIIWLPVVGSLIYIFFQTGKVWLNIETALAPPEFRKQLIYLLVGLYIYDNLVVGSFGVFQAWLPLPRINFGELISVFSLYLLVTRYKLIESLITTWVEKNRK